MIARAAVRASSNLPADNARKEISPRRRCRSKRVSTRWVVASAPAPSPIAACAFAIASRADARASPSPVAGTAARAPAMAARAASGSPAAACVCAIPPSADARALPTGILPAIARAADMDVAALDASPALCSNPAMRASAATRLARSSTPSAACKALVRVERTACLEFASSAEPEGRFVSGPAPGRAGVIRRLPIPNRKAEQNVRRQRSPGRRSRTHLQFSSMIPPALSTVSYLTGVTDRSAILGTSSPRSARAPAPDRRPTAHRSKLRFSQQVHMRFNTAERQRTHNPSSI